ncbi:hypothetical protein DN745_12895 [Bradymonas sediminis]|uniref:Uncharacterized protein n=1 Tax=Bradymonas sediminis TaxID=1548548 RepID=A0A2Z4FMI3_9DELT|nr:hypothetical protein DN745_12895 [Bradymonas sediminis]
MEGAVPRMPLRRVMTVAKNAEGGLIIHNGICLEEAQMAELERWGTPQVLVVPGSQHRLNARAFWERYEDLIVICPKGAREAVEQVVPVTMTYDEWVSDGVVEFEHLDGTREREGVMHIVDEDGRALVFNDIVFNMPHMPGFQGFILKHITRSSGGPRVSRLARFFFVRDRKKLREHLARLATLKDLNLLICSHHEVARKPAQALRQASRTV